MNDWLIIDEILGLGLKGCPKERSALSRKASREAWARRRRETLGRRGVTYEYLIPKKSVRQAPSTSPTKIEGLIALLEALLEDELEALLSTIKRKGAESLLYLTNDCNYAILQLPDSIKANIIDTHITLPPDRTEAQTATDENNKIYSSDRWVYPSFGKEAGRLSKRRQ